MSNPAWGYRRVWDVLMEVSYHLLERVVQTTASGPISTGLQTVNVGSTVGMYVGADIVIGPGTTNQEVVAITAVVPNVSFTATFANTHLTGVTIIGPTFPTQQPTDPFFTQSEMLTYISRAQNEFLVRVPAVYAINYQSVALNVSLQSAPATMLEMNRVATSAVAIPVSSLVRTSNVVTATTTSPHGLTTSSGPIQIYNAGDSTFNGVFKIATAPGPSTLTWAQYLADASTSSGSIGQFYRLYERTREELMFANPNWSNEAVSRLVSWGEDRSGNYGWFVAGRPASNFPVELLNSIRDDDSLALTDGFLIPDTVVHLVKYRVLQWAWDKDGEQRNPSMARYAGMRYERGILAVQRWLDQVLNAQPMTMKRSA